jgi:predicted TIM-barrel fold metal-dependent hydrolase
MIDDPALDPILDFLAKNKIPLIAHLAEPKECWMPLEKMVLHKGYYSQHPEYHMYLHPEYPSYEAHMAARDHMLEKHPDLTFINAHLGSLEWSLDELGKRLDRFPNMAVDLARMPELFLHAKTDWKKTREFFIHYQDRLLYATDVQVEQAKDPAAFKTRVHDSRIRYWTFFTTDQNMNEPNSIGEFKGLKLPREVVDKIYRKNAEKWLPGIKKLNSN